MALSFLTLYFYYNKLFYSRQQCTSYNCNKSHTIPILEGEMTDRDNFIRVRGK